MKITEEQATFVLNAYIALKQGPASKPVIPDSQLMLSALKKVFGEDDGKGT